MLVRIPMMATTTRSSMRVKPCCFEGGWRIMDLDDETAGVDGLLPKTTIDAGVALVSITIADSGSGSTGAWVGLGSSGHFPAPGPAADQRGSDSDGR